MSPACARRRFVTAKARSLSVDIPGEIPRLKSRSRSSKSSLGLNCTIEEAAGFFECSTRTLQRYLKRQPYADAWEYSRRETEGRASAGAGMAKAAAVDGGGGAVSAVA